MRRISAASAVTVLGVNQAIAAIKANGTLQAIYDTWIVSGQNIPFLQ